MIDETFLQRRLAAYRKSKGVSKKELSEAMGLSDSKALSAIENGDRELSSNELLKAVKFLDVPLEDFSDPYLIIGEAKYSWREADTHGNESKPFGNEPTHSPSS